ncbi:sodium/hydrogen exchanger 6-like isoform X2 [Temnothorax curvispinosus]|uniref:Sodium/hydrogen exchanger 6-like isoform X2 n=1 Tax=Temnothorax curvispinosus TaxID=300111 RepID=A0A6J1RCH6_9HYME|nr:sodium/hydrogen exchanger 6-like isoform X2 [Temnothorax curvispinosus]XP_024892669.1 sodium/hydrogen exchanger 6-like isoform X2 [Temnothorax curvispinosus]
MRRGRSPPYNSMQDGSLPGGGSGSGGIGGTKPNEKALLARIWGDFDTKYMKPLLTHSRPTLLETLPVCCSPLARILTTTQQMTQDEVARKVDSDSDFCLEDREMERRRTSVQPRERNDDDDSDDDDDDSDSNDEDLRIIGMGGFIPLRTL